MENNLNIKNNIVAPEAKLALNQMKAEVARELSIANPQAKDRGDLTSRQNGYVGGYIPKNAIDLINQKSSTKTTGIIK